MTGTRVTRPSIRRLARSLNDRQRWLLVAVLGALTMLGPFTMDLYLPAFPAVQHDLSTSEAAVQLTLTATAIGMGVGQLVVGPLSDVFGRRRPLLMATALHIISSAGVALAPSVPLVSLARFGQGVGAAASAVVTVAMVRDLFGGYRLVRMLARIALISGLAPIIAPVLGSQLLTIISWRGVFWVLALYGFGVLCACWFIVPETLAPPTDRENPVSPAARVRSLLGDRVFVGVAVAGGMVFAALVTYLSTSPFVFQTVYGLNAQEFGFVFAVNALGLLAATQASARLMRVWEPAWMLMGGLAVLLISGVALIIFGQLQMGLPAVACTCFVFVATTGFVNPCVSVLTLRDAFGRAGTAAALTGFSNSIVGGIVSPLPGLLGGASPATLGLVVVTTMIVGVGCLLLIARPWRIAPLTHE